MTSLNSDWVGLMLLTLTQSQITDNSVYLLLEGKTTDIGFSLWSIQSIEIRTRRREPYRH